MLPDMVAIKSCRIRLLIVTLALLPWASGTGMRNSQFQADAASRSLLQFNMGTTADLGVTLAESSASFTTSTIGGIASTPVGVAGSTTTQHLVTVTQGVDLSTAAATTFVSDTSAPELTSVVMSTPFSFPQSTPAGTPLSTAVVVTSTTPNSTTFEIGETFVSTMANFSTPAPPICDPVACPPGKTGPGCDVCDCNAYGGANSTACSQNCTMAITCNGHGRCDALTDGCLCFPRFTGANCSECYPGFSGPDCEPDYLYVCSEVSLPPGTTTTPALPAGTTPAPPVNSVEANVITDYYTCAASEGDLFHPPDGSDQTSVLTEDAGRSCFYCTAELFPTTSPDPFETFADTAAPFNGSTAVVVGTTAIPATPGSTPIQTTIPAQTMMDLEVEQVNRPALQTSVVSLIWTDPGEYNLQPVDYLQVEVIAVNGTAMAVFDIQSTEVVYSEDGEGIYFLRFAQATELDQLNLLLPNHQTINSTRGDFLEFRIRAHYAAGCFMRPSRPEISANTQLIERRTLPAGLNDASEEEATRFDASSGRRCTGQPVQGEVCECMLGQDNNKPSFFGLWSDWESLRLVGLPSPVVNVAIEESAAGLQVSWAPPLFTGYDDATVPILSYRLRLSLCDSFSMEILACETFGLTVSERSQFIDSSRLAAGFTYYIGIASQSRFGVSPYAVYEAPFQVLPTVLSPPLGSDISVVMIDGEVDVWVGNAEEPSDVLLLRVGNLPNGLAPLAQQTFSAVLRYSGAPETGIDVPVQALTVDSQGQWALEVTIPFVTTSSATELATIEVQPDGFDASTFILDVTVLAGYQNAAIVRNLLPNAGGLRGGGGNVSLEVAEFTGRLTREGAGRLNLVSLYEEMTQLVAQFSAVCDSNGTVTYLDPVDVSMTRLSISEAYVGWYESVFELNFEVPPLECLVPQVSTISLWVGSTTMFEYLDTVTFEYVNGRIRGLAPAAGVSVVGTGGVGLSFIVEFVDGSLTENVTVTLGDQSCDLVFFNEEVAGSKYSLVVRTPEFDYEDFGLKNLTVVDGGVVLRVLWEVLEPPPPFLGAGFVFLLKPGVYEQADPLEIDKDWDGSVLWVVSVENLFAPFLKPIDTNEIQVFFGSLEATDVSVVSAGSDALLFASFESILNEFDPTEYPVSVKIPNANGALVYDVTGSASGDAVAVGFKDYTIPDVVASAPAFGPSDYTNTLMVAVVNVKADSAVSATMVVDGTATTLQSLGFISLSDWDSEGDQYQALIARTDLWNTLVGGSEDRAETYVDVVDSLSGQANPDTCGFYLFSIPPREGNTTEAEIKFLWEAQELTAADFTYVAPPEGPAVLVRALTDQGLLRSNLVGGGRLRIEISNFAVVNGPDDVKLQWGRENLTVSSVQRSDEHLTVLLVTIPPGIVGRINVAVAPTRLPSNSGSFSFTYFDDSRPEVIRVTPGVVFSDVTTSVSVRLRKFPEVTGSAAIVCTFVDMNGTETQTLATAYRRNRQGLTTISVPCPPGETMTSLTIRAEVQPPREVTTSIVYFNPPSGPAVVVPTDEDLTCDGDSDRTTIIISNMRKVEDKSTLSIVFDKGVVVNTTNDRGFKMTTVGLSTTLLRFTAPNIPGAAGATSFVVRDSANPSLVAQGTINCTDQGLPVFMFVEPASIDVSSSATITVGVEKLGAVPGTSVQAFSDGAVAISNVTVSPESTISMSEITMVVHATATGLVNITLVTEDNNEVTFVFRVWGLDPRISDFTPARKNIYGRVPMTVTVRNFPTDMVSELMQATMVQFASTNVSASSVTHVPLSSDSNRSTLTITVAIPSTTSPGSVSLKLFLRGMSLMFPSDFTYSPAPRTTVSRMLPSAAPIGEASTVKLYVDKLPGVERADQIQVVFQLGTVSVPASKTYTAVRPSLNMFEVQSYEINVDVPTTIETQGLYTILVSNTLFSSAQATGSSPPFRMVDTTLPQIARVTTVLGEGFNSAAAPSTRSSLVTIVVTNVPAVEAFGEFTLTLGGFDTEVSFDDFDRSLRTAKIGIFAPPAAVGAQTGVATFPAESGSAAAEFTLQYIDDTVPTVDDVTPRFAPAFGGSFIEVTLTNFPSSETVVENVDDISASFGAVAAAGTVFLTSSSIVEGQSATVLQVLIPPYELGELTSLVVPVTITHPDVSLSFGLEYFVPTPEVTDVSRGSSIPSTGGDLQVTIAFFEFPVEDYVITFDGFVDSPSSFEYEALEGTSSETTYLSIAVPATSPGEEILTIYPRACGRPCTAAVQVPVTITDAAALSLAAPVSIRGAVQDPFPPLRLANVMHPVGTDNVTVHFRSSSAVMAATINSVQELRSNVIGVSLTKPASLSPGEYDVEVEVGEKKLTYVFTFFDGDAPRLESVSPSSVPAALTIGSRQVDLRTRVAFVMANIPSNIEPTDITVSVGGARAEVLSVRAPSSNRTVVDILAPAMASPSTRAASIIIQLESRSVSLSAELSYEVPCDFESFCGGQRYAVDVQRLSKEPVIACDVDYCIDPNLVESPTLKFVSPKRGPRTGGTVVTVEFENLPAFSVNDVTISTGIGGFRRYGTVTGIFQSADSTTFSGSGSLTFITPGVTTPRDAVFEIVVNTGSFIRSTTFEYKFLKRQGVPTIASVSPMIIYESQDLDLFMSLEDVTALSFPFNLSRFTYHVNGASGFLSSVLSSTDEKTDVAISVPGPFTPGPLSVSIFPTRLGETFATSINITVLADPTPAVKSSFPKQGLAEETTTVNVIVSHLPFGANASDFTAQTESEGLAQNTVFENATVVSLRSLTPNDCESVLCTQHEIVVEVPANPAGDVVSTATLHLQYLSDEGELQDLEVEFTWLSSTTPAFEYFFPRSVSLSQIDETNITMMIRNFPTAGCGQTATCAAEIGDSASIRFGSAAGRILAVSDSNGMLLVSAVAGIVENARDVQVVVTGTNNASGGVVSAETFFDFAYKTPALELSPLDGRMGGGSVITLTARAWGRASFVQQPSDVVVTIDDTRVPVLSILEASWEPGVISVLSVTVRTPPSSAGMFPIRLSTASGAQSSFGIFEYYETPTGVAVPDTASTLGVTSHGDEFNEIRVTLNNFPFPDSAGQVSVIFGEGEPCVNCISTISTDVATSGVILDITVPPSDSPGETFIFFNYTGDQNREEKVAFVAFSYFLPAVDITSFLFCDACGEQECLSAGQCNNTDALEFGAPSSSDGDRVATLTLLYAPVLTFGPAGKLDDDSSIVVLFGSTTGELHRVLLSNADRTIVEVKVPKRLAVGSVISKVTIRNGTDAPPVSATFSVSVFDPNLALSCGAGACEGPEVDAPPIVLTITAMELSPDVPVLDQIKISFGSLDAFAAELNTTNDVATVLSVTPPQVLNAGTMLLSVSLIANPGVGASTTYTSWGAPKLTAATFNEAKTSVTVEFDVATDRGSSDSCVVESIFDAMSLSLLGANASCSWTDVATIKITLAPTSALAPQNFLTLAADNSIRSENGISPTSQGTIRVDEPELTVAPVVTVSGPTHVDPCASLTIKANVQSPREVTWTWGCVTSSENADCGSLTTFLQSQFGDTLSLAAGTPELVVLDEPYVLTVVATDFLGVSSDVVEFSVTKSSSAVPTLSFEPGKIRQAWDQAVILQANTIFSTCPIPQEAMVFKWTQVFGGRQSGPAIDPQYLKRSTSSQLVIPAGVLEPGAKYTLQLDLSMASDSSKSTSAQVEISSTGGDIFAFIEGGSEKFVSAHEEFTLDGSLSFDEDFLPEEDQDLVYEWKCRVTKKKRCKGYGKDKDDEDEDKSRVCPDLSGETSPTLTIPAGTLAPSDSAYRFQLLVSKPDGSKTTSRYLMRVFVSEMGIPTTSITPLIGSYEADSSIIVNREDGLLFTGNCSDPSADISWSIEDENGPIQIDATEAPFGFTGTGGSMTFKLNPPASPALQVLTKSRYWVYMRCEVAVENGRRRGSGSDSDNDDDDRRKRKSCYADASTLDHGYATLVVNVNDPPTGETCEACRVTDCQLKSGTSKKCPCEKTGVALQDQFQYVCKKWSDGGEGSKSKDRRSRGKKKNPSKKDLDYQFGYTRTPDTGNATDVDFAWVSSNTYITAFAAGEVTFRAQVRDSLGATSILMEDTITVIDPLALRGGRRLLQLTPELEAQIEAEISSAKADITAQVQAAAKSQLNAKAISYSDTTDARVLQGQYTTAQAIDLKTFIATSLHKFVAGITLTSEYSCETVAALQTLTSNPDHITAGVAKNLTVTVGALMGGIGEDGGVITTTCTSKAYSVLAALTASLDTGRTCWSGADSSAFADIEAVDTLSGMETALVSIGHKYSLTLVSGEPLKQVDTTRSTHLVGLDAVTNYLGVQIVLTTPVDYTFSGVTRSNVTFVMPASLANSLGGETNVVLHASVQQAAPAVGSEPISPLVTIAMSNVATGTVINVAGLTDKVSVTVPLSNQDLCSGMDSDSMTEGTCAVWDGSQYTSDGCTTTAASKSSVTCMCDQLASFAVLPVKKPQPTTSSTTAPKTTAAATTAPATTAPATTAAPETTAEAEPDTTAEAEPDTTAEAEPDTTPTADVVPTAPTFSVTDGTLTNNLYSAFVEIEIATTSDGISWSTVDTVPSCDNGFTLGSTVTVSLSADATVYAVSCSAANVSSSVASQTYSIDEDGEGQIGITFTLTGVTSETLVGTVLSNLRAAFATEFDLNSAQVAITATRRRRTLLQETTEVAVTLTASSANELTVATSTAQDLTDASVTTLVAGADTALADVIASNVATTVDVVPVTTPEPTAIPPVPVITVARGTTAGSSNNYVVFVALEITTDAFGIAYTTNGETPVCTGVAAGQSVEVALSERGTTTVRAVSCSGLQLSSQVVSQQLTVVGGSGTVGIRFILDNIASSAFTGDIIANLRAAFATKFNLHPAQVAIRNSPRNRRMLLAMTDMSVDLEAVSDAELSATHDNANDLTDQSLTEVVANADPALADVTASDIRVLLNGQDDDNDVNVGLIVGVTLACVITVCFFIGALMMFLRYRKAADRDMYVTPEEEKTPVYFSEAPATQMVTSQFVMGGQGHEEMLADLTDIQPEMRPVYVPQTGPQAMHPQLQADLLMAFGSAHPSEASVWPGLGSAPPMFGHQVSSEGVYGGGGYVSQRNTAMPMMQVPMAPTVNPYAGVSGSAYPAFPAPSHGGFVEPGVSAPPMDFRGQGTAPPMMYPTTAPAGSSLFNV